MHAAKVGGAVVVLGALRRTLAPPSSCDAESAIELTRVITVRGTAHQRGRQLHAASGADAAALAASRRALYSADGLALWEALAASCVPAWQTHAPVAWAELEGRVAAGGNLKDLLMLGTDFEMQMAAWRAPSRLFAANNADDALVDQGAVSEGLVAANDVKDDAPAASSDDSSAGAKVAWGRCTAFAATGAQRGQAGLCGQNVDEEASGWRGGACDAVVRLVNDSACSSGPDEMQPRLQPSRLTTAPTCAVYTHPGVPGYCGMNDAGLCVLDLYIDEKPQDDKDVADAQEDDEDEDAGLQVYKVRHDPRRRQPRTPESLPPVSRGLPIDVTIRELLTFRDLKDAVAWLEALPRAAPSTYLLLQVRPEPLLFEFDSKLDFQTQTISFYFVCMGRMTWCAAWKRPRAEACPAWSRCAGPAPR